MKSILKNQPKMDLANKKLDELQPGEYTFAQLLILCAGDLAWQPFSKVVTAHPKMKVERLSLKKTFTKLGD